ncbi:MAG: arginase family protein [Bacteroidales bacterium]
MINLNDYFDSVSIEKPEYEYIPGSASFSHNVTIHTENNPVANPERYNIAIIGVPEERNSPNAGCEKGPESVRRRLYMLSRVPGKLKIIDLGNMKKGVAFTDTLSGLTEILSYLIGLNVFPLIIGGNSSLLSSVDNCFTILRQPYTLATIDSRIDFHPERNETDSFSCLNKIIYNNKSTIQHFINIGYQTYLNDLQTINRLIKRKADLMRIGDVRKAIHLTEPLLRDADAVILDIASVRQSDAPGTISPSPNGFYGEEICLIARYAGISDNLKIFCLFEVNPLLDRGFQTSDLAAQIIWFFLEGFGQKQNETPMLANQKSGHFTRYHVRVSGIEEELVFVKSNMTERWWIEVKTEKEKIKYIACAYEDYLIANRNEMPERWIKAMEKYSE